MTAVKINFPYSLYSRVISLDLKLEDLCGLAAEDVKLDSIEFY